MPALTFQDFLLSAPGELLLEWEKKAYSELTADVFGSCALQIGMPQLDTLAANRMQAHWLIAPGAIFATRNSRSTGLWRIRRSSRF